MINNNPVRLAMIGAGRHASLNIYPYFHFLRDKATVVANCDLDAAKAGAIAGQFGIARSYTDYRTMLDKERPDGVLVCISDTAHAELSVALMEAGVHVYVEKPHASHLGASRRMLACSQRTGRICMAAYKKRFAPSYRQARELLVKGDLGRLTCLRLLRSMGGGSPAADPGYLWQWGSHGTDLVCYLGGPVASVQAMRLDSDWRSVVANLRFVNGAVGQLTMARSGGSWEELLLLGEDGHAVKVENTINLTCFQGDNPCAGHWPSFIHGYTQGSVEMGYVGELQEFVAAIAEHRQPESNIAQATHTLALHEAIVRAVASRAEEPVEQFDQTELTPCS